MGKQFYDLTRAEIRELIAVSMTFAVAYSGVTVMPIQIGAVMDGLNISSGLSGLLGALEIFSIAITTLILSLRKSVFSNVNLAFTGTLIAVCSQLGSALVDIFFLLALLRVAVGVGVGCIFAAGVQIAACSRDPDRLYALAIVIWIPVLFLLILVLPLTIDIGRHQGVYITLAAFILLLSTSFKWLIQTGEEQQNIQFEVSRNYSTMSKAVLVVVVSIFALGTGAIFAFSERIGMEIGLSLNEVSIYIAFSGLAGLGGAMLSSQLGIKYGRTGPVSIGLLLTGVSSLILSYPKNEQAFVFGLFLCMAAYMFVYPYVLGTAAIMEKTGKYAIAVSGIYLSAYAGGIWTGSIIFMLFDETAIGTFTFSACVLAAIIVTPLCKSIDRRAVTAQ